MSHREVEVLLQTLFALTLNGHCMIRTLCLQGSGPRYIPHKGDWVASRAFQSSVKSWRDAWLSTGATLSLSLWMFAAVCLYHSQLHSASLCAVQTHPFFYVHYPPKLILSFKNRRAFIFYNKIEKAVINPRTPKAHHITTTQYHQEK
jgi:hypothetical protein